MKDIKLDKYDDAFLFSIGLTGIVISFLEINRNDLGEIAKTIPFVLLGIVAPFIVGFLRGAVQQSSIEERIRGWIYFLVGTTSYFAFFVVLKMSSYTYVAREAVFIAFILLGVGLAFLFVKWSKRVFALRSGELSSYAFSATTLGVFVSALFLSMFVGIYLDFQLKNIVTEVLTNFNELLFWISILFFILSAFLILEKGAQCALLSSGKADGEHILLNRCPKRLRPLVNWFPIKSLFLGLALFEFTIDYDGKSRNLQSRMLWLLSFTLWVVACLFWRINGSPAASAYFIVAICISAIALAVFSRTSVSDFKGIDNVFPTKISYMLIVFMITFLIALGGSLQQLIIALLLWTGFWIITQLPKTKRAINKNVR